MYHFIVNPHSRSGKGHAVWISAEKELVRLGADYEVHMTQYVGHAKKIARELTREPSDITIVVIGGDGTINEVLSGLVCIEHVRLGYIPTGSGNDFAKGMRIPQDEDAALRLILDSPHTMEMDIGMMRLPSGTSRFGVSAGMGLDAAICYDVQHSPLKRILNHVRLGRLTYFFVALKQLLFCSPSEIRVTMDGNRHLSFPNAYLAAAFIQPSEGGGLKLCPQARADDGVLDVCVVSDVHKLKVALLLPTAFFGLHTRIRGVHILRCKQITIQSSTPLAVHRDGESAGTRTEVTLGMEPQRIRVICPKRET